MCSGPRTSTHSPCRAPPGEAGKMHGQMGELANVFFFFNKKMLLKVSSAKLFLGLGKMGVRRL